MQAENMDIFLSSPFSVISLLHICPRNPLKIEINGITYYFLVFHNYWVSLLKSTTYCIDPQIVYHCCTMGKQQHTATMEGLGLQGRSGLST